MKQLLDDGANPNAINITNSKTALMIAAYSKSEDERHDYFIKIALLIMKHPEADLNLRDNEGNTALVYAVKNADMLPAMNGEGS